MNQKSRTVPVIVTLTDEALPRFSNIMNQLTELGLKIDYPIEVLGQLVGQLEESRLATVSDLRGVKAVEIQQDVHIPPFPTES